jgi:hypothetical protein
VVRLRGIVVWLRKNGEKTSARKSEERQNLEDLGVDAIKRKRLVIWKVIENTTVIARTRYGFASIKCGEVLEQLSY